MSLERLVEKIRDNDVVLWAGSGYSLYAGMPSVHRLTQRIKEESTEEEKIHLNKISSLTKMSSVFVDMRNGSKNDLYRILREEFEIKQETNWVHNLLAEIPQISTIVTTNYDKLFEESYRNELDVVFSNEQVPLVTKRNVLYKIHGDIDLPGSMVVTDEDYTNFFRNQDTPVWNKIKSLFAEKTVVFVGYSLADQNIDFLYENIMGVLEDSKKETYLIAPNLPKYQINRLNRKEITYIDMTGEDFTNHIHKEVKKNLLIDINEGRIEPQLGLKVLEKHKLLARFESSADGIKLRTVGTNDKHKKMNLNLKFKGINFFDKFRRSPFDIFEISGENIKSMTSNFEGIEMPKDGKLENMIIKPLPVFETVVDLYFKGTEYQLLDVKLESYTGFGKSLFRFTHQIIKIELNITESELNFSIGKVKNLKELREILLFLRCLFSGEHKFMIYLKSQDKEVKDFIQLKKGENPAMFDEIEGSVDVVNKLMDIQQYYEVRFRDFEFIVGEDDIAIIDIIWADIKNDRRKTHVMNVAICTEDKNFIEEFLKEENNMFYIESKEQLISLDLFNQSIKINRNICITCNDAYVLEPKKALKRFELGEKNINIKLGSKKDGFQIYLD